MKYLKYVWVALLVMACLYKSHKAVYWAGWHRGGEVILYYITDSLMIEVDKAGVRKELESMNKKLRRQ